MRVGVHDHRHRNQILSRLPDCRHSRFRTQLLGNLDRCPPDTLPPNAAGVLDFHLIIDNRQPHRPIRLAFDDNRIVPGILDLRGKLTPHMPGPHKRSRPAGREKCRDGRAAVTRGPGPGQRTDAENEFICRVKGLRSRRNLIPQDLVSQSRSSQDILIFFNSVFRPDFTVR